MNAKNEFLKKWIVVPLAIFIVASMTVGQFSYNYIIGSFETLDKKLALERVSMFQKTLASERDALTAKTFDWATWDEAYEFVQTGSKQFVDANIVPSVMESMGLQLIAYLDNEGRILSSRTVQGSVLNNSSEDSGYFEFLEWSHPLMKNSAEKAFATPVLLSGKPAIAAAMSIRKADGSGPFLGRVVMVQLIEGSFIESLREKTELDVQLIQDSKIVRVDAENNLNSSPMIIDYSGETTSVQLSIQDVKGTGIGYYKFNLEREILKHGTSTASTLSWVAGLLTLLVGFIFIMSIYTIRSRKEAQKNSADREQLKALLESIPGYVSWFDKDLNYLGVNRRLADDFQIPPSEFFGKKLGFNTNQSTGAMTKALQEFYASSEHSRQVEIVYKRQGSDQHFLLCLEKYLEGQIVIAIGIDISEQRKLEKQIEDDRATNVNAGRLAALGQLAGSIAHEINNPLMVIQASNARIGRILKDSPELPAAQPSLEAIDKTVWRIASIIKGLRSATRDGSKDPMEPARLKEIIEDVVMLCSTKYMNQGVQLIVPAVSQELCLVCRSVQIGQILTNLVNNAFDATVGHENRFIKIDVRDLNEQFEILVIDSGNGIPQEIVDKMMAPFYTTKPIGVGTGLGLSISRSIVEDHKGTLAYRLEDGHTAFVITLPKSIECGVRMVA